MPETSRSFRVKRGGNVACKYNKKDVLLMADKFGSIDKDDSGSISMQEWADEMGGVFSGHVRGMFNILDKVWNSLSLSLSLEFCLFFRKFFSSLITFFWMASRRTTAARCRFVSFFGSSTQRPARPN